jgi:putative intracellular protease/amidase
MGIAEPSLAGPAEPVAVRGLDGVWQRRPLAAQLHAALFARLLLGGVETGWLHVWCARRRADGRLVAYRRDPSAWVPAGETDRLVAQAIAWHARGLEVFAGALGRERAEPIGAAVLSGAVVWADVDAGAGLERLREFCAEHPAHYRAASGGGGRHAAWLLADAHPAEDLVEAVRRIAAATGGDAAVCHRGASLRVPGTRNGKPGAGWCGVLAADLALAPYPLERLVADLPAPAGGPGRSGWEGAPRGTARRAAPSRDPLHRIAPPVYVRALCGVDVPDGGGWISCPLPGHDDVHPSCLVHADPVRGWRCFSHPGGPVGGRVYDLASALTGGPTGAALRGASFLVARERAAARLPAASAAT